jgi:hypothetical protein
MAKVRCEDHLAEMQFDIVKTHMAYAFRASQRGNATGMFINSDWTLQDSRTVDILDQQCSACCHPRLGYCSDRLSVALLHLSHDTLSCLEPISICFSSG